LQGYKKEMEKKRKRDSMGFYLVAHLEAHLTNRPLGQAEQGRAHRPEHDAQRSPPPPTDLGAWRRGALKAARSRGAHGEQFSVDAGTRRRGGSPLSCSLS
jgi:hypothetical protein